MVGLLRVAGPLEEQQQRLVPGRLAGGRARASIRGPMSSQISAHTSLAGRPSAHGYLRAQGVAAVGGVAEERQLRPPRHPHREPRRQQDADRGLQALRPFARRSRAGSPPSPPGQIAADLVVGGEDGGAARRTPRARRPLQPPDPIPLANATGTSKQQQPPKGSFVATCNDTQSVSSRHGTSRTGESGGARRQRNSGPRGRAELPAGPPVG